MTFDVDHVLSELSVAEKATLTSGSGFWWTAPVERLDVPTIMVSDGPHGLRAQPGAGDHVGIGGSLPATCFPTASAIASSWDPELLHEIGTALAREARACNLSVILGPGINMKRSPLCGRNFEYFSEDPYLAGELGVAIVDGIQSLGVGTSVKHFAANNQETDRMRVDAQIPERVLREIYLPAFERIITGARPWTVMCAYNKINGRSASENPWLLTTVLRDEWGYEGVVVSDWGAVYHRVPALAAGCDLEMPPALPQSPDQIVAAVTSGELPEQILDRSARRVLELVALGAPVLELDEDFDVDAHHALARRAAGESVVLLTNEDDILPLAPGVRVGVIGEFARTPRFQGAGSSQVNPTRVDSVLDELRSALGSDVPFAPGYVLGEPNADETDGAGNTDGLLAEAVRLAESVDVVVLLVGLPGWAESEGLDRTDLRLPADQLALVEAVTRSNPSVVTVLVNGATVEIDDVVAGSQAVLEAWLGGQAAGGAIADVLTGAVNPSGRLAETIAHRLEDNPSFLNFPGDSQVVRYGEGLFIGYRGFDAAGQDVAFPFGYGLSYTEFTFADLDVSLSGSVAGGDLAAEVAVTVTNTGERDGAEVVQVYVADVETSVARPVRELKGFTKVRLAAGESTRATITLSQRAFSFWSEVHAAWVVEPGAFAVQVGPHSRALALQEVVEVDGPSITAPLGVDSTLQEWLADPDGRELIAAAAAAGEPDPARDPELVVVIGSMPMSSLANFTGMSLSHAALADAAEKWRTRRAEPRS